MFFSSSAQFKYECNCFHLIHRDELKKEDSNLMTSLHQLCRSYKSTMSITFDGRYDITYEASNGDYWVGSTEGLANVVYDSINERNDLSYRYLHEIKPRHLQVDYYFLYLLLLNQKYSALQYIYLVSKGSNEKLWSAIFLLMIYEYLIEYWISPYIYVFLFELYLIQKYC